MTAAGQPVPEPEGGPLGVLDPEIRLEHALDLAYRHLARRDRTVVEVRRHLAMRGVDEGTVTRTVRELERQGYLDDGRYPGGSPRTGALSTTGAPSASSAACSRSAWSPS